MKDIVSEIRTLAESRDYHFFYGPRAILNIQYSYDDFSDGSKIFALFPVVRRSNTIYNSIIGSWSTELTFLIGRKFDSDQVFGSDQIASLDEFYIQKYYRRLIELTEDVNTFINMLVCQTGYSVVSISIRDQVNDSSENIDFVRCDITLEYDDE